MTTISPDGAPRITVDASEILRTSEVHFNVREQYVVTTEDKIRLCLSQHLSAMEQREAWVAPATTLLALVGAIVTAEFKDVVFSKYTWQALFVGFSLLCGAWLAWALIRRRRAPSMDDVVHQMKKGAVAPTTPQGATGGA
jgi:hypothetical protein